MPEVWTDENHKYLYGDKIKWCKQYGLDPETYRKNKISLYQKQVDFCKKNGLKQKSWKDYIHKFRNIPVWALYLHMEADFSESEPNPFNPYNQPEEFSNLITIVEEL